MAEHHREFTIEVMDPNDPNAEPQPKPLPEAEKPTVVRMMKDRFENLFEVESIQGECPLAFSKKHHPDKLSLGWIEFVKKNVQSHLGRKISSRQMKKELEPMLESWEFEHLGEVRFSDIPHDLSVIRLHIPAKNLPFGCVPGARCRDGHHEQGKEFYAWRIHREEDGHFYHAVAMQLMPLVDAESMNKLLSEKLRYDAHPEAVFLWSCMDLYRIDPVSELEEPERVAGARDWQVVVYEPEADEHNLPVRIAAQYFPVKRARALFKSLFKIR